MSEETPYDMLRSAVRAYGEAAMENFLRCRAFGYAVADGLAAYLAAPEPCVSLVPASGPFDPKRSYGDRAFTYDPKRPIRLEPMAFGLCVTIPHEEDSGSLWVRTGVRVEVKDDRFDVFVAHQPLIRIPVEFEGQLAPVFERIMAEYMQIFRRELADFGDVRYQNTVGFVPIVPNSDAGDS